MVEFRARNGETTLSIDFFRRKDGPVNDFFSINIAYGLAVAFGVYIAGGVSGECIPLCAEEIVGNRGSQLLKGLNILAVFQCRENSRLTL